MYKKLSFSKYSSMFFCMFGVIFFSIGFVVYAQDHDNPSCDAEYLARHWAEHTAIVGTFAQKVGSDIDSAIRDLYLAGIGYQALAKECGFTDTVEIETEHNLIHGLDKSEAHNETETEHDTDSTDLAMSIGDPENGQLIFGTIQPETGFACATCHFTDSMERLIGPGLMGIGNPAHDPNAHADGAMDMSTTDSDHADDEMDGSMDMSGTDDDHADDEMGGSMDMDSMNDTIIYIRTSILSPSDFVAEGFPDNLMPAVYGEIFSEQELNDLVAYLLTLQ